MNELLPSDFISQWGRPHDFQGHHSTGPEHARAAPGTPGPVFVDEGRLLAAFAARHGGPVLEFGGSIGVSTRYIHEGLTLHGGQHSVYSIDLNHIWREDEDWPLRKIVHSDSANHPRLIQYFRTSGVVPLWAFIDGDHSHLGVLRDTMLSISLGARALLFHDCQPDQPLHNYADGSGCDARRVVDSLFYAPDWHLTYLPTSCGMVAAIHKDFHGSSG